MSDTLTYFASDLRRPDSTGRGDEDLAAELANALASRRTKVLPTALETRFQSETADEQAQALSRAALLASLFYNVQIFAEASLTPDAFGFAAALHFGFVTPALLLVAAFPSAGSTPLRRDILSAAAPVLIALQVVATYFASVSPGAAQYAVFLAVVPILANASLPLSTRATLWTNAICLALLAIVVRAPHVVSARLPLGAMAALALCVVLTVPSALRRNREARRAYLLDLRNRLKMAAVGAEARVDPLTGLSNRRMLEEAALRLWATDGALVSPVSVVIFDVDRFKAFNDLYGHQAGDACLRRIGGCALAEIQARDEVAARYGGEEFVLLLPRTSLEEARQVAERLRASVTALRVPHAGAAELGVATASFGVACANVNEMTFENLIAAADAALYRAKRAGRNRVATTLPALSA